MPHRSPNADDLQCECTVRPYLRRSIRIAPQVAQPLRRCLQPLWRQSCARRAQNRERQLCGRHLGIDCRMIFLQRSPTLARDECQVAARTRFQRLGQDGKNGNGHRDRETTLFSLDCANTIFDVLSAETNGVAAAKSGVEQHIQPDAFTHSDGPTFLIGSNVFLSPGWEAVSLFLRWIVDPDCWIGLNQLGAGRPSEQSRKCRAWTGVAARRSRPTAITAVVSWLNGLVPAVSMICRNMLSRFRRVVGDKLDHAIVSR